MTSSRLEPPTHTTGAHRAHGRASRTRGQRSSTAARRECHERYDPYLDGLFTYCLSVMCDHDAATALLGDVLAIAERQRSRCPSDEAGRKAWLYALARWVCLRRLAEQRRERQRQAGAGRQGPHAGRRPGRPVGGVPGDRDARRAAAGSGGLSEAAAGGSARSRDGRGGWGCGGARDNQGAGGDGVGRDACDDRGGRGGQDARGGRDAWDAPGSQGAPGPRDGRARRDGRDARDGRAQGGGRAAERGETAARRREELALLAWPEAAGTSPEQREALELAIRHGLAPREVAAVLGMDPLATRELLATAACEVERTRAALAVVESGNCPSIARLTGDSRVVLSAALRQELVRHVDDCPRCRRVAERVGAGGPWPGTAVTPATLPLAAAPRAAVYAAMLRVPRARASAPRFGPGGYPMDPKDCAARRERLRARALTTTVVATVVAAPVLALWAAYRGAPLTGESHGGTTVSAREADGPRGLDGDPYDHYDHYENAGNAQSQPDHRFTAGGASPDVSVEVISSGTPAPPTRPGQAAPGRLTVEAQPAGDSTRITLRASGGAPVSWSLWSDAPWLQVSRASGVLRPGEPVTVYVTVDRRLEPEGPWSARVGVDPSGAVVEIDGRGRARPAPSTPPPSFSPAPDPDPTPPPASDPPPSSSPAPDPEPTPPPASDPPSSSSPSSDPEPTPPPSSDAPSSDSPPASEPSASG
ncbi:BACON domain-containing protein [Streptomyces sp. PR69]|uniref:BACON domain-containing protein n=1 Tax=Streptomyces sp. PR69 TaxID=2984950 RepID=UPI0022656A26|nr:hypothetical protein [Streptomyces sp. PR69]